MQKYDLARGLFFRTLSNGGDGLPRRHWSRNWIYYGYRTACAGIPIATSRGRHAPRPSKLIRSNLFQRKLGVVITNRIRISNILSTRNLIFSAQRKRTKKKLYPTISYPKKASPIVHRRTISKSVSFSSCKKSRKHIC